MEQVKKKPSAVWQSALIGIKLLLICAVIAALISFVYAITLDKYNSNMEQQKAKAIGEIFGSETLTYATVETDGGVLYAVKENEADLGFCAEVASPGFGGDIQMMVGFDAQGNILGVSIVSLSETPGLGAKVSESDYLAQYKNQNGELTLGEDVDAISGATISSRAVIDGVNIASCQVREYLDAQKGGAQ